MFLKIEVERKISFFLRLQALKKIRKISSSLLKRAKKIPSFYLN